MPEVVRGQYLLEAESSCEGQGWLEAQENCWDAPRWSLVKERKKHNRFKNFIECHGAEVAGGPLPWVAAAGVCLLLSHPPPLLKTELPSAGTMQLGPEQGTFWLGPFLIPGGQPLAHPPASVPVPESQLPARHHSPNAHSHSKPQSAEGRPPHPHQLGVCPETRVLDHVGVTSFLVPQFHTLGELQLLHLVGRFSDVQPEMKPTLWLYDHSPKFSFTLLTAGSRDFPFNYRGIEIILSHYLQSDGIEKHKEEKAAPKISLEVVTKGLGPFMLISSLGVRTSSEHKTAMSILFTDRLLWVSFQKH